MHQTDKKCPKPRSVYTYCQLTVTVFGTTIITAWLFILYYAYRRRHSRRVTIHSFADSTQLYLRCRRSIDRRQSPAVRHWHNRWMSALCGL